MTELDLKQKEKEEALQRRKEELEDELESYARAGAFSPGLIKFTRWLSRGLYLAMAVGFMVMLFSGWGKVSQEEFDRVHEGYTKWKKEAEDEKTARTEAQDALLQAEIRAAKLKLELEGRQDDRAGVEAAAAQDKARNLSARYLAEMARREKWQNQLTAHQAERTDQSVAAVTALLQQAAKVSALQAEWALRDAAEQGRQAIEEACLAALVGEDDGMRSVAASLLYWVYGSADGTVVVSRREAYSKGIEKAEKLVVREVLFADSLAYGNHYGPIGGHANGPEMAKRFEAEYLVRFAFSGPPEGDRRILRDAYPRAPEENRLEALAVYAESVGQAGSEVFASVATSDRPAAEKVIAVRWMGARKDEGSRALLKTLSDGQGVLAKEAKEALKKLDQ